MPIKRFCGDVHNHPIYTARAGGPAQAPRIVHTPEGAPPEPVLLGWGILETAKPSGCLPTEAHSPQAVILREATPSGGSDPASSATGIGCAVLTLRFSRLAPLSGRMTAFRIGEPTPCEGRPVLGDP